MNLFYSSKKWRKFRETIIAQRGNRCEKCGNRIAVAKEIVIHHIKEIDETNVDDAMVSLNPDNVMVVCHSCHNKIHPRGAASYTTDKDLQVQQVFIVYGPPLSGKNSYVKARIQPGDLVVDMDSLYEAVSGLERYHKPDKLLPNVRSIHSQMIDNIKTRYGRWNNAWIIGGYPDKYRREKLANDLGAKLVFIEATKEVCLNRLANVKDDRANRIEEWTAYIDKWFEKYVE